MITIIVSSLKRKIEKKSIEIDIRGFVLKNMRRYMYNIAI